MTPQEDAVLVRDPFFEVGKKSGELPKIRGEGPGRHWEGRLGGFAEEGLLQLAQGRAPPFLKGPLQEVQAPEEGGKAEKVGALLLCLFFARSDLFLEVLPLAFHRQGFHEKDAWAGSPKRDCSNWPRAVPRPF